MGLIRRVWNPEHFQGPNKKRSYFEGWYHKHVPTIGGKAVSVIVGVAYDDDRQGEAFIQLIYGTESVYLPYPVEDFRWDTRRYEVLIGPNRFSSDGLFLHIDRPEAQVYADLHYSDQVPLQQRSLTRPGIMGWYRFVPRMECYHGVVSLDHTISGEFEWNELAIDLNGGRGYIEKDWGRSMPESWIWYQSNSFSAPGHSVMFSVARIPWLRGSFPGFLAICHTPETQQRFTTYNKSAIVDWSVSEEEILISFQNTTHELQIRTQIESSAELMAPANGRMTRPIQESLSSQSHVRLTTIDGYVLFEDRAHPAGLETVGSVRQLLRELAPRG